MALVPRQAERGSRCELCEERIEPDELIVLLPDDAEWVHAGCAEDEGHVVAAWDIDR